MSKGTATAIAVRTLTSGLVFGESPRWHDGRLWFADFGAREVGAVDPEGQEEIMYKRIRGATQLGFPRLRKDHSDVGQAIYRDSPKEPE